MDRVKDESDRSARVGIGFGAARRRAGCRRWRDPAAGADGHRPAGSDGDAAAGADGPTGGHGPGCTHRHRPARGRRRSGARAVGVAARRGLERAKCGPGDPPGEWGSLGSERPPRVGTARRNLRAPPGAPARSRRVAARRGAPRAATGPVVRAPPAVVPRVVGARVVSGARAARSRSPEVRRRERRLRRAVVRYRGCLDGLPALERRVLVLRSGVGSRRARTRARVGRALDLSAQRVGRIERRGLRRLRGLGDGGCGGGGSAPSAGAPVEFPADGFGRAALAAMTFGGGEPALAAAPEERPHRGQGRAGVLAGAQRGAEARSARGGRAAGRGGPPPWRWDRPDGAAARDPAVARRRVRDPVRAALAAAVKRPPFGGSRAARASRA